MNGKLLRLTDPYSISGMNQNLSKRTGQLAKEDTWKKFKTPLLVLLTCVGVFIFFTQDTIYQKVTGLLASSTSLLPLLTNLFNSKDKVKAGAWE